MKHVRFLTLFLFAATLQTALAAPPDSLIAYYPMRVTANDTTGHLGPLELTNAPFVDGSLYCNGKFFGDSACWVTTPLLPPSIFQAFSVSVKFKMDTLPTDNPFNESPVLMGGVAWRWMGGMVCADSTVAIRYNNSFTQPGGLRYSLHTWHEMVLTYDSSTSLGCLYLDSTFACSVIFDLDHGSIYEAEFCVNDRSRGTTFRGYLRDLKIYSVVLNPTSVQDLRDEMPADFQLYQNYPNPFNPSTSIEYTVGGIRGQGSGVSNVQLMVYDVLGREVAVLVNEKKPPGFYTVTWNARGKASGVYFYRLTAGGVVQSRKLLLLR